MRRPERVCDGCGPWWQGCSARQEALSEAEGSQPEGRSRVSTTWSGPQRPEACQYSWQGPAGYEPAQAP